MKLPWDRDYFKISIYVIVTAVVIYILKLLMDALFFVMLDIGDVFAGVLAFFAGVFKLFAPLLAAFVIAYILEPVAAFYQRIWERHLQKHWIALYKKIPYVKTRYKNTARNNRTAGTILTYLSIIVIVGWSGFLVYKRLDGKAAGLYEAFAGAVNNALNSFFLKMYEWNMGEFATDYVNGFIANLEIYAQGLAETVIDKAASAGGILISVSIGFVVAFYFLKDKDRILARIRELSNTLLPPRLKAGIHIVLDDLNYVFSGYIRGQLTDAVIMAGMMSGAMWLIKVDFPIFIGVVTGFSNVIPFLGAVVGFILAVGVALIGGSPMKAFYAAAAVIILQQIDGMVVVPKVVGQRVQLSPPVVILALYIAGRAFGILGMFFAVPVCAVLKILLERMVSRYKIRIRKKTP